MRGIQNVLCRKSGFKVRTCLNDPNFLMPQVIGCTHDKQLLGFPPNHTPPHLQALSQELLLQPYPRYYRE